MSIVNSGACNPTVLILVPRSALIFPTTKLTLFKNLFERILSNEFSFNSLFFNPTNLLLPFSLLNLATAKYFELSSWTGDKPCLLKCWPKALAPIWAKVLKPLLYKRVGPGTSSLITLNVLAANDNTPPTNPSPPDGYFLTSSFGLLNCNPIWRCINKGPFGLSLRNLLILSLSIIEALSAVVAPPLIKPSSTERANEDLLGIAVTIYGCPLLELPGRSSPYLIFFCVKLPVPPLLFPL